MSRWVVVGAGGHARETAWVLETLGHEVVGYMVSDLSRLTERDSPVLGALAWLSENPGRWDHLAIGIGTPGARRAVRAQLADFPDDRFPPVVAPSAVCDRARVVVGPGAYVGAGAVLTVNITLGAFSVVNFGATVGHETQVGAFSVVNPGASLSGGVNVGEAVLVGTGARVLQYLAVGDGAVVGAGAVVTRAVAPGQVVVGVPARPKGA